MTTTLINKLNQIDLDNIYVENVRSIFNISHRFAKYICETAVRLSYLERRINICCPNSDCEKILHTYKEIQSIKSDFSCLNCELLEKEKSYFNKNECSIIVTYKYIS